MYKFYYISGSITPSVTCPTAEPRIASSIPAWSHTFVEIDHEIISTVILLLNRSRRVFVNYKLKYVHKEVVNRLFNVAQENSVSR